MPRLTDALLKSLKPKPARYEVPDTVVTGLRVSVHPSGNLSWVLRYRRGARQRKWTIGRYPMIGLADARDLAKGAHLRIARGHDPAAEKLMLRSAPGADTVAAVVDSYIERECKNLKTRETATLLRRDVVEAWGSRQISEVRRPEIHAVLDRCLDRGMPVRANKLLGAMRRLWRWAIERGYTETSPVEGIRPPHREVSRDRVLTDEELVSIWRAAKQLGWPFGKIVQLLILTGQRRNEVAGACWTEIDLERRLWSIPRERRKGAAAHEVPLSEFVTNMLGGLPRFDSAFVFPAQHGGKGFASGFSKAKARLDDLAGVREWRLHDLRRTCATGLQRLGVKLEVVEEVLGHTSGSRSGIIGVYQRHRFADEKRDALAAWARHLQQILQSAPELLADSGITLQDRSQTHP